MNQEVTTTESAVIKKSSKMSIIWVLPILAAAIGLWMIVHAVMTAGIKIDVQFDSADGIVVGKTEVRYKGLTVGVVKGIDISDNLDYVIASIEMDYRTEVLLKETTDFWIVRPEVSLSKISGLETVFGGNYISLAVGEGKTASKFVALKDPAPVPEDAPGLHISLTAANLGSVSIGSHVFYKKIAVGKVIDYKLEEENDQVKINLLINKKYAHLVKSDARFWNASGIEISGDLSGFSLRTESLGSIIAGGIAFYNPDNDNSALAENKHEFKLYDNFEEAQSWFEITMHFDDFSSVTVGKTKLKFANHELGFIKSLELDMNTKRGDPHRWIGKVLIDPKAAPYITESTEFWIETPKISLGEMDSFSNLLEGAYLAVKPGKIGEEPKYEFYALSKPPVADYSKAGLHLQLQAKNLSSVSVGQGVYYREMKVGSVEGFALAKDEETFDVHIHILEEFEYLVNDNSIFFEDSGVEFSGNLQSFNFKSRPLQSMLAGGISFEGRSEGKKGKSLKNGDVFVLYESQQDAKYTNSVYLSIKNQEEILENSTRLMYRGEQVGIVSEIKVSNDLKTRVATIKYDPLFKKLFVKNSVIWMVEPKISAGSLTGLDALVSGSYLVIKAGNGKATNKFVMSEKPPAPLLTDPGLQLVFSAKETGSVAVGSPVLYLQKEIGQVESVGFNGSGKDIKIIATIDEKYSHFVKADARFYLASGIKVGGNLGAIDVRTESFSAILRGGIALLPSTNNSAKKAKEMQQFELFSSQEKAIVNGTLVELSFDRVVDLKEGASIKFANHIIGSVEEVKLNNKLTETKVILNISKNFPSLYASDAKFWLSTAQIGLAKVQNPEAIITGNYISVIPGFGRAGTSFKGLYSKPVIKSLPTGLNIRLKAATLGSLKIGDPIYYRQIKVGEIIGHDLSNNANTVDVYVNINAKYKHLLNENTRFWNASGIDVDAGIFSGVKVRTESIETILSGGLAFATPADGAKLVNNHAIFDIYDEPKQKWLDWQINH